MRTIFAGWLLLAPWAVRKPLAGIVGKLTIFFRHFLSVELVPAVEADH
jgi:hypothetical protein